MIRESIPRGCRRGDRVGGVRHGMAAGEHGDDLCPSLRRGQRRSDRHHRRPRAGRTRHLAVQYRRGESLGADRERRRDAEYAKSADAFRDDDEPGPRRNFRNAYRTGPQRPRRNGGDGRQYISWIHDQDFIRSVYWLIEHEELTGPMNLASPNPLPNRNLCGDSPRNVGSDIRPARNGMAARDRRLLFTDRNRAHPAKLPGRSEAIDRFWL